jgi:hypothetical protein
MPKQKDKIVGKKKNKLWGKKEDYLGPKLVDVWVGCVWFAADGVCNVGMEFHLK